jgi:hypothetical protein
MITGSPNMSAMPAIRPTTFVTGQKQRRNTIRQVADTRGDQQDAQEAGEESRLKYKNPEGEKPEAKDPADNVPVAMQIEEQHGQGFASRWVEYGQEIRAAQKR